jgi:hypothetical protein
LRQVKTKEYACNCRKSCGDQKCYFDAYNDDTRYTKPLTISNKETKDTYGTFWDINKSKIEGTIQGDYNTYPGEGYI